MIRAGAPVRELRVAAYRVPTDAPEADGTLSWDATTLVVVDADAGDVTGVGWTYGDPGCVAVVRGVLADTVTGFDVIDVPGAWHAMQRRVRNVGRAGVVSSSMSAVEIAFVGRRGPAGRPAGQSAARSLPRDRPGLRQRRVHQL